VGFLVDLLHGAAFDDLAFADDDDGIGEFLNFAQDVAREEDAFAFAFEF